MMGMTMSYYHFIERDREKKTKREGGREGGSCKKNVSIEHRGATALDTAWTVPQLSIMIIYNSTQQTFYVV